MFLLVFFRFIWDYRRLWSKCFFSSSSSIFSAVVYGIWEDPSHHHSICHWRGFCFQPQQTKHGKCSGSTVRGHNTFRVLQRYPWARYWTLKCSYRGIYNWHPGVDLPTLAVTLKEVKWHGMRRVKIGGIKESQETLDPPLEPVQARSIKRFVRNHIWLVS